MKDLIPLFRSVNRSPSGMSGTAVSRTPSRKGSGPKDIEAKKSKKKTK